MGRIQRFSWWRVAVVVGLMVPTSAALLVGGGSASAGAAPAPLSCRGGEPLYSTAPPGQCFMGYLDTSQWNDWPIPIEGGTAPYTVSLVSGDLPTGGALESNGYVEGFGLIPQDASFVIHVTDSSSPPETLTVDIGMDVYENDISPGPGGAPGQPGVIALDDDVMPGTQWLGPLFVEFHGNGGGGQTNPLVTELLELALIPVCEVQSLISTTPDPGCDF